jgi:hypothetical protein
MEDLPRTFHGRAKSLENRAERASTDLNENVLKSMRYADRTFLDMVGVTGSIPVAPTIKYLMASIEVHNELKKKDDELFAWCKQRQADVC